MPSTWKEGSNDGKSRQEQLHQHDCARSAAETLLCASSTKHPSQMLNRDSPDKPTAPTGSAITSLSSIPKKVLFNEINAIQEVRHEQVPCWRAEGLLALLAT